MTRKAEYFVHVCLVKCCRLREQRERLEQRHQDEIESLTKKSAEHKTRAEALQTDVNNRQVTSLHSALYNVQ